MQVTNTNTELLQRIANYLGETTRGKLCIGYEQLTFDDTPAVSLAAVPATATSAEITVEDFGGAADTTLVCRYTIDGVTVPTNTVGVPLGKADTIEITNHTNIVNFKVIGIDAALTQVINVHYYA